MLLKKFLNLSRKELENFLQRCEITEELVNDIKKYQDVGLGILGLSGYRPLNSIIVKKNQLPMTIFIKPYGVNTCSISIIVLGNSEEHVEIVYNYETGEVRRILYFDPTLDVKWMESLKDVRWIDVPQTLIDDGGKKRDSNN